MFVKIMSQENLADSNNSKQFELFAGIEQVEFRRESEAMQPICFMLRGGEWIQRYVYGNAYVMTNEGKTFETFAFSPYAKQPGEIELKAA